jgi:hypothetical protein
LATILEGLKSTSMPLIVTRLGADVGERLLLPRQACFIEEARFASTSFGMRVSIVKSHGSINRPVVRT